MWGNQLRSTEVKQARGAKGAVCPAGRALPGMVSANCINIILITIIVIVTITAVITARSGHCGCCCCSCCRRGCSGRSGHWRRPASLLLLRPQLQQARGGQQ